MRLRILSAALVFLLLPALPAQTPSPQPSHPTSTPYTGNLGIFDEPGRDRRLQIDYVMSILGIKRGKTVADIGAGGGWFTVRAAHRVGPTGHVLAEDINPQAIQYIRQRAANEHLTNVEEILGTPDDPNLPSDSLDAALMLKVYHEIAHPALLLAHLRTALKPGARFGIIDRNGNGADHGLDEKVLRAEVEANGFQQVARYDFTRADGQDYFLVFTKK